MIVLSRQLHPRSARNIPTASSYNSGADPDGEGVGVGVVVDGGGVPSEEEGSSPGDAGFPGAMVKGWWRSVRPYTGAAGFGLMREEMLIKSNAQQVWREFFWGGRGGGVGTGRGWRWSEGIGEGDEGVGGRQSGDIVKRCGPAGFFVARRELVACVEGGVTLDNEGK